MFVISGFCHIVNEVIHFRGSYKALIDSYQHFRRPIYPFFWVQDPWRWDKLSLFCLVSSLSQA